MGAGAVLGNGDGGVTEDLEQFDADVLDCDPEDAVKALRAALAMVGIVLPDLHVECEDGNAWVPGVELGTVPADVAMELAGVMLDSAAPGEAGSGPHDSGEAGEAGGPVTRKTGSRSVFRFVNHSIAPDREPGAEPVAFAMRCAECGQQSRISHGSDPLLDWALVHAGRYDGHHSFREVITRPYRVWPTEQGRS